MIQLPTLQEVFLSVCVFTVATCIIISATLFVIIDFLVFKVSSCGLMFAGIGMLMNHNDVLTYISSVTPFTSISPALDAPTSILFGFLLTSLSWCSFFVGSSESGFTKAVYSFLVSTASFALFRNRYNGGKRKRRKTYELAVFQL